MLEANLKSISFKGVVLKYYFETAPFAFRKFVNLFPIITIIYISKEVEYC